MSALARSAASDAPRRGVPPALLWLGYLCAVLLPLVAAFLLIPEHRMLSMRLSGAFGMAAAAMLLLQMISSGRFEAISGRLGIDVTMAFHKWAAPIALGFALLHLGLMLGWPDPDRPGRLARRLDTLTSWSLWHGWALLVVLALLVALALGRDRLGVRYQVWRASHAVGAVLLVGLLLWHIFALGPGGAVTDALWAGFALLMAAPAVWVYLHRLTRPEAQCWRLTGREKVADRLWSVQLSPIAAAPMRFRAGQFVWAAFGGKRLPLHDHPFSIASGPQEPELRLLVQEVGDFTRTVGAVPIGTPVGLDGPHGAFGVREDGGTGALLLIAGGVGIAPILSVLSDLAARGTTRPVRFAYAARAPEAMVPPRFYEAAAKVLGIEPLLLVDKGAGSGLDQGPLSDAHLRHLLDGTDPADAEALICGPGAMMTAVADRLEALGVPPGHIDYERFSYGAGRLARKDWRRMGWFALLFLALAAVLVYSAI